MSLAGRAVASFGIGIDACFAQAEALGLWYTANKIAGLGRNIVHDFMVQNPCLVPCLIEYERILARRAHNTLGGPDADASRLYTEAACLVRDLRSEILSLERAAA